MTKKEILDYIIETPGNTNRAVLSGMLDSFEGGSGGGGTEPLIVGISTTQEGQNTIYTMDKTWKEIRDAFPNVCTHVENDGTEEWTSLGKIYVVEGMERPYSVLASEEVSYQAESENGYPTYIYSNQGE